MKKISVHTAREYSILIGRGLLSQCGQQLRQLTQGNRVCIVSDDTVWPLYGSLLEKSLENAGFTPCKFVFPHGESSKNGMTYLSLLNTLAAEKLTRTDWILALGGGVVGDLAGFAAATYLRGIPFLQVPTTVLAAVDSSVGGKTAIDLPAGKNLAGAFCQPRLVLCDLDTLDTLPAQIFQDGCAEILKYALLYDRELFTLLGSQGLDFDREEVIARCVQWKAQVVAQDEFDRGMRMKLNLGHTIGHALEMASDFSISHGQAVAMGMVMVSRIFAFPETQRLVHLVEQFGLPSHAPFPPEVLLDAILSDKKRLGDTLQFIVPRAIGDCAIVPVPVDELPLLLKRGS